MKDFLDKIDLIFSRYSIEQSDDPVEISIEEQKHCKPFSDAEIYIAEIRFKTVVVKKFKSMTDDLLRLRARELFYHEIYGRLLFDLQTVSSLIYQRRLNSAENKLNALIEKLASKTS